MHKSGKFFFLPLFIFTCGIMAIVPKTAMAGYVFLTATPSSGVAEGTAGLEVKLTCSVSAASKPPKKYIIDYGDGSAKESVDSNEYTHTFTHSYNAGVYKAVCEVQKSIGSLEKTDPVSVVAAKWRFETGDDVESSPAIGPDGTIYIGSDDGNLYAVDPGNGIEKWRFQTGGPIVSTPSIDPDGVIYFGSLDKNIYALKPSGELKWAFKTSGEVFSSPAIWPDRRILYIGSNDHSLYALNAGNGTFRWKFDTGDKIISSPSIGYDGMEHVVYFGSMDNHVYALAAATVQPKLKWKFKANAGIYASPAIGSDGRVYIGELQLESVEEYRYKFYSLNLDGTMQWSFMDHTGFYSSPAIGPDGTIFVGSRDGRFFALNPDGSQLWAARPGPPYTSIDSSPAIGSNAMVYTGSRKNLLFALETDMEVEDRRNWTYAAKDSILYSSPVIDSNGTIYFGSQDNNLYAIEPGNLAPAESFWPMYRGNAARTGMAGNIHIPDIISTDPMSNSANTTRTISNIKINFSPNIDLDRINIDSFQLEKITADGNELVEGYAVLDYTKYNDVGYRPTAVFTRLDDETPLPYETSYKASITYSSTDEGAPSKTYTFTFKTELAPPAVPDPDPEADFGCFIGSLAKKFEW